MLDGWGRNRLCSEASRVATRGGGTPRREATHRAQVVLAARSWGRPERGDLQFAQDERRPHVPASKAPRASCGHPAAGARTCRAQRGGGPESRSLWKTSSTASGPFDMERGEGGGGEGGGGEEGGGGRGGGGGGGGWGKGGREGGGGGRRGRGGRREKGGGGGGFGGVGADAAGLRGKPTAHSETTRRLSSDHARGGHPPQLRKRDRLTEYARDDQTDLPNQ